MSSDIAVLGRELPGGPQALAARYELGVEDLIAQVQKIQHLMAAVMKQDEHYGIIPGTGTKPTLLKPGAEKLCLMFRLAPDPHSVETWDGKHLTVKARCDLYHIPTGQKWGSGEGSCSTKESRYAYRNASRLCPECGKDAIIKGKEEYGGGWLCFAKRGGCGAKFKDGAASIEGQVLGRVANEDLADQYNTVLKMANKRALVAAVLNVTAASDIFTQDLEDMPRETPRAGAIIEVAPEPEPAHRDDKDRRRLLEQIKVDTRFLGLTRAEYKRNWTEHIGPNVSEEAAPIAGLMRLGDELAARVAGHKDPIIDAGATEVPF